MTKRQAYAINRAVNAKCEAYHLLIKTADGWLSFSRGNGVELAEELNRISEGWTDEEDSSAAADEANIVDV